MREPPFTNRSALVVCLAAAFVGVLCLSLHLQAQQRDERPILDRWLAAVARHSPGTIDEWVTAVAPWTASDLAQVLAELDRDLKRSPRVELRSPAAIAEHLKRGALLHADIAILHRADVGYGVASSTTTTPLVNDGRADGRLATTAHWDMGRRLLSRLPRPDDLARPDEDVLAWYRATAAVLQVFNEYSELAPHLNQALKLFPADPVLQLFKGSVHEYFAEPKIQLAAERLRSAGLQMAGPSRMREGAATIGSAAAERREALRHFDRALGLDAGLHEARVRRANVLHLDGQHEDAVQAVAPVLAGSVPGPLRYFALLVQGRSLLSLGRLEAARDACAAAIVLFPDGRAARQGLSQAWLRLGNIAAARSAASLQRVDWSDPWLTYHQTHVPDAETLLSLVRDRWR